MFNFPTNELPTFDFTDYKPVYTGKSSILKRVWHNEESAIGLIQFEPSKKQEKEGNLGSIYRYANFGGKILDMIDEELEKDGGSVGGALRREVFMQPDTYPVTKLY